METIRNPIPLPADDAADSAATSATDPAATPTGADRRPDDPRNAGIREPKRGPGRPKGSKNAKRRKSPVRGVCQVCGAPASSAGGTYCVDHKRLPADRPPTMPSATAPSSGSLADTIAAQLETQIGMAAMLWTIKDPVCGPALGENAEAIAAYWGARAASSPRIAAALSAMTGAGGILGGIVVHLPLLIAITQHHVMPAVEARNAATVAQELGLDVEPEQTEREGPGGVAYVERMPTDYVPPTRIVPPPVVDDAASSTIADDPAAAAAARAASMLPDPGEPEPWAPAPIGPWPPALDGN